jgi:hypothetical protein
MTKTFTIVWYFYRPLLLVNIIFSAVALWDLYLVGVWFILLSFFIKIIGYAATAAYQHYFNSKPYLYYLNAGYSIKKMYTYTFSIDFAIYLAMVACLYLVTRLCSL